jgi:hypothetical protein
VAQAAEVAAPETERPAEAQPAAAPKLAPAVIPTLWMVSPAFDLTFFVATALVVLLPWVAIEHYHVNPFFVVAAVGITSNGPHLISTWTRVYLDGNERFRRPLHYWVVPALIATMVITLIVVEGRASSTLHTILLYWAWWHFMMQNWGILRIYQRRQTARDAALAVDVPSRAARRRGEQQGWAPSDALMMWLERIVLTLGAIWPLTVRLFKGPWSLFGAHIKHPTLHAWQVNAIGGVLAVSAGVYLLALIIRSARGRKIAIIRPLVIAASCFGFYVPFVMIRASGTAGFAAAACWHGLQYLGIVWFYNRNRWKGGVDRKARVVSWVSQGPRRAPLYFLFLLGVAGIVYASLIGLSKIAFNAAMWGSIVWISLTFGHYWLDGVIWKLRKPELQQQLINTK